MAGLVRVRGVALIYAMVMVVTASVIMGGCDRKIGGQARADKAGLQTDTFGCPDLTGTYAFNVPDEHGTSYSGSILEDVAAGDGSRVPAAQISGIAIRRVAPGMFDVRFFIDDARVMQHLGVIREFEKPRYREWYHLLRDPERAAWIARNGETAYAEHLARLGPRSELVKTLRIGSEMTCRDGWLELPRAGGKPIRLTLGMDGSIIGESRELSTVGITVWCGDGCKDLPIPTGTFTGALRWPRDDARKAWRPEAMANRFVFERPIDEIEAEVATREHAQARSDALRYASADAIRMRIEALAPSGTVVDDVAVRDGKVRVRYTAPVADEDKLLAKVADAGGLAPQNVQHGVTSGHFDVRSVEFTLTDSPLVLRDASGSMPETGAREANPDTSAAQMAVLQLAVPGAAKTPNTPPVGFADPAEIRRRAGALFPGGSRIADVRYGGGNVVIVGEAGSNRDVSDGLRALYNTPDGQGANAELLRIEAVPGGKVRFEILLHRSALVSG